MRPHSRSTRVAFRSAVGVSVAIHVVVAVALFVLLRSGEQKPREAAISTRASTDPDVRMRFTEDAAGVEISPQPVPPTPPTPAPPSSTPEITPTKPAPTAPQPPEALASAAQALPAGPFKPAVPNTLPPELVALIHKPGAITTSSPPPSSATRDPNVKPASATGGSKPGTAAARAMHGALGATQTVVYVLDTSGSMGAAGKFDAARAALVATLKQQPATVRFQVVVYDSAAHPLLASNGTALPATEANIRAATAALAALEPRGKSNHLVAVRAALGIGPDFIVLLTDADDLTARTLKPVLSSVSKAPPVRVGLVTPEGVQQPRELK